MADLAKIVEDLSKLTVLEAAKKKSINYFNSFYRSFFKNKRLRN